MKHPLNLIWLDMEMTGLDPDNHRILELAMIVTNKELDIVAQSPVWVIHQSEAELDKMDNWNRSTHGKSGLIEKVNLSTDDEDKVQHEAVAFLSQWVNAGESPLCGNSVSQDRRFLYRYMPTLEAFFHYRHLDVSTLKELARRWQPSLYEKWQKTKESKHQALADIIESIDELRHYRMSGFVGGMNEVKAE